MDFSMDEKLAEKKDFEKFVGCDASRSVCGILYAEIYAAWHSSLCHSHRVQSRAAQSRAEHTGHFLLRSVCFSSHPAERAVRTECALSERIASWMPAHARKCLRERVTAFYAQLLLLREGWVSANAPAELWVEGVELPTPLGMFNIFFSPPGRYRWSRGASWQSKWGPFRIWLTLKFIVVYKILSL